MKNKQPHSLWDWRKGTVASFRIAITKEIRIRDRAQRNIDDLIKLSRALTDADISRPSLHGTKRGKPEGPEPNKKPHWTQTAAGKRKMASIARKTWRAKKVKR